MKTFLFISLCLILSSLAHAEGKATICYDDAKKEAASVAADRQARVSEGRLGSFDNIEGAQVEGWVFPTNRGGVVVILGIAGEGDHCQTSLIYAK